MYGIGPGAKKGRCILSKFQLNIRHSILICFRSLNQLEVVTNLHLVQPVKAVSISLGTVPIYHIIIYSKYRCLVRCHKQIPGEIIIIFCPSDNCFRQTDFVYDKNTIHRTFIILLGHSCSIIIWPLILRLDQLCSIRLRCSTAWLRYRRYICLLLFQIFINNDSFL